MPTQPPRGTGEGSTKRTHTYLTSGSSISNEYEHEGSCKFDDVDEMSDCKHDVEKAWVDICMLTMEKLLILSIIN